MKLLLGFVSHAKTVLPHLAGLTLDHEFASIRVVLSLRGFCKLTEKEGKGILREHIPALPHMQRVIPWSSSSGSSAGMSSLETSDFALETVGSAMISCAADCFSFSFPLRFARPLALVCLELVLDGVLGS